MNKANRTQKNKVLEACRCAAETLKTTSYQILSDTSLVCLNNPDDITEFLAAIKPYFDQDAWDHTVFYSSIRCYLPSANRSPSLCSYDFYRALNKVHYFSAESAVKRIREFGRLKALPYRRIREFGRLKALPYRRYRSNIRGVYRDCSSSVLWFTNEINANWKQFLAIGARLAQGEERSLYWKNYHAYREIPIKAVSVDHTQFDIHVQGLYPGQTIRQVEMFLAYCDKNVFSKIVRMSQYCYRITIEKNTPEPAPAPLAPQEVKEPSEFKSNIVDPFRLESVDGNPNFVMLKGSINTIEPKQTLVEEHYAAEIEKSINEITLIVDGYDRQIDELTAKADKMRAQRGKLLRAYKALTERK